MSPPALIGERHVLVRMREADAPTLILLRILHDPYAVGYPDMWIADVLGDDGAGYTCPLRDLWPADEPYPGPELVHLLWSVCSTHSCRVALGYKLGPYHGEDWAVSHGLCRCCAAEWDAALDREAVLSCRW